MLTINDFKEFLQSPISDTKNFTWSEALFLNEWQIHVMPDLSDVFLNIELTAKKMQKIRDFLNEPITVTSWFRPLIYNKEINGSKKSSHLMGMACDFKVKDIRPDEVRTILEKKLIDFNIRMENLPGATWTHIDTNCSEKMSQEQRFFKP